MKINKSLLRLYKCFYPLIYLEGDMERANIMPIYWLGAAIGDLLVHLNPNIKVGTISAKLLNLRSNIEWFINTAQSLPLSKDSAKTIMSHIDMMISPDKLMNPDATIDNTEVSYLNTFIFNFQAVLGTELPRTNMLYVTPKRAYDMTMLINQGESVLSDEIINNLGEIKTDVIKDIREATKSLAFDIATSVGFHIYRAIETIVKTYFPIIDIKPDAWGKHKNLGNYIKLLESKEVNEKVTIMLKHLKDHYRNPISHPEEFWDSDKAESAFGLAISIITVMVQDIAEIKSKDSGSQV